jgi:hypothetical protein
LWFNRKRRSFKLEVTHTHTQSHMKRLLSNCCNEKMSKDGFPENNNNYIGQFTTCKLVSHTFNISLKLKKHETCFGAQYDRSQVYQFTNKLYEMSELIHLRLGILSTETRRVLKF